MNILTLLDIVADVDPDRVVFGDRETGMTYAQLRALAARSASWLDGQPGRPVLFAGTATTAFPVALFGAAAANRPFAPISYRLGQGPLQLIVDSQVPAQLIADDRTSEVLEGHRELRVVDPEAFLGEVAKARLSAEDPDHDPENPAVLLHTSGTTGSPKVAVLRHRHLTSYVLNTTEMLAAGADEAALVSVPPYHIAGIAGLLTGLYSGRRQVQLPRFDPRDWINIAVQQRITHAMVVPTMLGRIVDVLEHEGIGLPDLRHLSYGGGRMPISVIERALRLLPDVNFVNAYGLTETTSSIALLGPEDHRAALTSEDPNVRERLGSVGRPLPSVEITVRDEDGRKLAAGQRGELWVRGPQVSGEYASASVIDSEGWFRTNDGGWMDSDGYVYVEGRLDDVIVRGAENLSPGEIEDVLSTHPAVSEVVVFGIPDDHWGEIVVAAIVRRSDHAGFDESAAQDWVAKHLRSSRVPAEIRFLDELPRNELGKVLRRVLKQDSLIRTLP